MRDSKASPSVQSEGGHNTCSMAPTLLFITGVPAALIAGFILSRVFGRSRSGDGSGEIRLLEGAPALSPGASGFLSRMKKNSAKIGGFSALTGRISGMVVSKSFSSAEVTT